MKPKRKRRWRVDYVQGQWISVCGPDYESESEYRVVDVDTGAVAHVFLESGNWPFMCGPELTGTASVVVAADNTHVVVKDHDGKERSVPLPD